MDCDVLLIIFIKNQFIMKRNDLYSLIDVLNTYKNNNLGLHLIADDCKILAEKLRKICKKYNIQEFEDE